MTLTDSFGRAISYLRLSITDRCNLRCLYCMPSEGVGKIAHADVMRFEELLRVCRIFAGMGISAVRVTGGEPLARKGAADFVGRLKAIAGIKRVTMTSNGSLLGERLPALVAAGLDAVNVSLDTLDEERFRRLTRGGGGDVLPGSILSAVDRALDLGLEAKINCVPILGFNEEDIAPLAALARTRKIAVRFIELMPLGAAAAMQPLPISAVAGIIEKAFGPLTPSPMSPGSGPAVYHALPGFAGHIGIIGALSRGFCENCNRLRLTASGVLKPCLSSDLGIDLRRLVRDNASDKKIESAVAELVGKKPAGHSFGAAGEKREHRQKEMFRIGG